MNEVLRVGKPLPPDFLLLVLSLLLYSDPSWSQLSEGARNGEVAAKFIVSLTLSTADHVVH